MTTYIIVRRATGRNYIPNYLKESKIGTQPQSLYIVEMKNSDIILTGSSAIDHK